ncbi:MAG: ATP-binding protein [Anaerolineae bacterium]|nr:ATP-binding protein [Anaerolineae bacterium]
MNPAERSRLRQVLHSRNEAIAERWRQAIAPAGFAPLSPTETRHLIPTLRWYGEQFTSRAGVPVTVQGEEPIPRLAAQVKNALCRITQEALTNVTKHARASQVTITVTAAGQIVCLVITDDGVGFDRAQLAAPDESRGWGLLTMTERAEAIGAQCRIEFHPQQGTRVIVEAVR